MQRKYEAALLPALAASFQMVFTGVMAEAGFARVMELSPAAGFHIWEFRRGTHLVTMTRSADGGEKERLAIESEAVDFAPYVLKAVLLLADEFLGAFERLTETLEDRALRGRLRAWHEELRGLSQTL